MKVGNVRHPQVSFNQKMPRPVTARRTLAALFAGTLAIGGAVSFSPAASAAPTDGTLTIIVDRDYVGSGIYDPAIDVPQPGIDITVSDATGHTVTGTTDASGTFTVVPSVTLVGGQYRVVASIPTALSYLEPSLAVDGGGFSSLTSFMNVSGGAAKTVRMGVWDSTDYAQVDPPLATAVQAYNGGTGPYGSSDPDNRTGPETRAVVSVPGTDRGDNRTGLVKIATQAQVGTTYGLAYKKTTEQMFSSAFAKSHALYSPAGPGAIYISAADGSGTQLFATVPDAGTAVHDTANIVTDAPFFLADGTQSLGGLVLSADGSTLYVVNLNNNTLYAYNSTTAALRSATVIPDPGCVNGNWRPFALSLHNKALYIGGVCDAATGTRADLQTVVLRQTGAAFAVVFSHPLTDLRGDVSLPQAGADPTGIQSHWNPWMTSVNDITKANASIPRFSTTVNYPQPELTGLAFDRDGSLILGFRDRFGDQVASNTGDPRPGQTRTLISHSGGDINRACINADGSYSWEGTGSCPNNGTTLVSNGNQRPTGVAEYYPGDFTKPQLPVQIQNPDSWETAQGGLLYLPRQPDVVSTQSDPAITSDGDNFQSDGFSFYDRATGIGAGNDNNRGLHISGVSNLAAGPGGGFQKSNGLGDIEALVDNAPLEIGNRVWIDTNHNGVQDAGEAAVAGVTVQLKDNEGTVVATATTDANGEYYFSSGAGTSTASTITGLDLTPGTDYTVTLPATNFTTGAPLAGYAATTTATGTDRTVDSNGAMQPDGSATAAVMTGAYGAADHTIDFGFVRSYAVGDYVWIDTNRDGRQGAKAAEPPVEGVKVTLYLADGTTPATHTDGTPVTSTTTDSAGHYVFTDLPAGDYRAKFTTFPAGYTLTTQAAGTDTAVDSNPAPSGLTPVFTLGPIGANLPEMRLPVAGDQAGNVSAINPTIDAGLIRASVSVGDYVWVDTNRNGIQNPGEPGIPGVVLKVTGPDGKAVTDVFGQPVGPQTTDSNGKYLFPNLPTLPAGQHYTVTIDQTASKTALAPYVPTVTGKGTTATDSSTNLATSSDLTTNGAKDLTLDFGFVTPSVSVGDYVWVDTNRNGIQNPGEPGIPGVVLKVTGPDGKAVTDVFGQPVGPQTTDSNGKYLFPNLPTLPAGQHYTVTIDQTASKTALAPYVPTVTGKGTTATDSSTNLATSSDLTTNGAKDLTLDFGFVTPLFAVGDYVWIDANHNGIQDSGETPVAGVTVTLHNADGTPATYPNRQPVPATTTDANGHYVFDGLGAGSYYATFSNIPAGYEFTTQQISGSTPSTDSNPSNTGRTPTFTLGITAPDMRTPVAGDGTTLASLINPTIDAGLVQTAVVTPTSNTATPTTPAPSGDLSYTGVPAIGRISTIGLLLLVLGGAALMFGRRRRNHRP